MTTSINTILPLQAFMWSSASSAGDLLRRCGVATRRYSKARFDSLRRRSAAGRSVDRAEAAAEVRAMAMSYLKTDPGFAADLFAAAARHEVAEGA